MVLVIERVSQQYPRMRFHVQQVRTPTIEFPELYERKIDLVLARLVTPPKDGHLGDDFDAEVLFDDPFSVVVGQDSKWGRRRRIDLTDLVDEPWIFTAVDALAGLLATEAFEARGLKPS